MRNLTWEESSHWLRVASEDELDVAPSLLVSEGQMRWKNAEIGDYEIISMPEQAHGIFGGDHRIYEYPYSRLVVVKRKNVQLEDGPSLTPSPLGPALSSIMSFSLRSLVISYNEFASPLALDKGKFKVIFEAKFWAKSWMDIFFHQEGLRYGAQFHKPSPEEEQQILKTMEQVYEILMNLDEETYQATMGGLRLYQLAFLTARVDYSLAYSLLVASIDAVSKGVAKVKGRLKDIDPKGELRKAMGKIQLDERLQNLIINLVTSEKSLTESISTFIVDNLPKSFWEGDYSMMSEVDMFESRYSLRDISDSLPDGDPVKKRLLEDAEKLEKQYENYRQRRSQLEPSWVFNKKRRRWMGEYLQDHLDRVLRNAFSRRSKLFHYGTGFPKYVFETPLRDWVPDIIEEDFWEFREKHIGHKWDYSPDNKGRIIRKCNCGDKKEIEIMLGIRLFERMVHDSILKYILKLG